MRLFKQNLKAIPSINQKKSKTRPPIQNTSINFDADCAPEKDLFDRNFYDGLKFLIKLSVIELD